MEEINQHFSKRILFLSIIFLLIAGSWHVLSALTASENVYQEISPKLNFAQSHDIQIKTVYDSDYHTAVSNQSIIAGTQIKTGEHEFAEISLDNNNIRLDQNTEIGFSENNFGTSGENTSPRLVFTLKSGNIWVNAYDNIRIKTTRSDADFYHSIVMVSRSDPMNRLMVITGSADLNLYSDKGVYLTSFSVPLRNQVAFTDNQIVDEYSLLRASKLKKELKLAVIADSVLEDEWVLRNINTDDNYFVSNGDLIYLDFIFNAKDKYYKIKSYLTFNPVAKYNLAIDRTLNVLNYVLGKIHKDNLKADAKELLAGFDDLIQPIQKNDEIVKWLTEMYYAIGTVKYGSPAYLVKEKIFSYIFSDSNPELLRTYFSDLRLALSDFLLEDAEKIASDWIEYWDSNMIAENMDEFEVQAGMLKSLILTHIDKSTTALLNIFDTTGELRIKYALRTKDEEEVRYAVTEGRLEIASGLVSAYRYLSAKSYLAGSYESLGIDNLDTETAVKEVFLKNAELLAQRIKYAEDQMHGAAISIDEKEFQDYLMRKERDELLSENLKAFLQGGESENVFDETPEISDVIQKFANARISIIDDDVMPTIESPYYFEIKNARLIDRSADGSSVTFDAVYDYSTNAVNDVLVSDVLFKGNFDLNDLVAVLTQNGVHDTTEESGTGIDISDLLIDENDEALRAQITAQDLAETLVINELAENGLQSGMSDIDILDVVNLSYFDIKKAYIQNSNDPRNPIEVRFEYKTTTKKAYNLYNSSLNQLISSEIEISRVKSEVLGKLFIEQQKEEILEEFKNMIKKEKYLSVESGNVESDASGEITFKDLTFTVLLVKADGVYDMNQSIYKTLNNDLYSAVNVSSDDYFRELGKLYIISYLNEKGIVITEENLVSDFPYTEINIQNYTSGDQTFNFKLSLSSNRLENITLVESGASVDYMSFEDFLSIAQ